MRGAPGQVSRMQRRGNGGLGGGIVRFYLGGGGGGAELLGKGTALVQAPVNTPLPRKMQLESNTSYLVYHGK